VLNSTKCLILSPYSFKYCRICVLKGKTGVPFGKSFSANVMMSRGVFAHKFVYIGDMNVGGDPRRGGSKVKASILGIQAGLLVSGVYNLMLITFGTEQTMLLLCRLVLQIFVLTGSLRPRPPWP
jgi:hypothetical protein